ncbi:hypothetical protein TNCV_3633031 [Trichonephila clavipes]|nr:hypothetical protein TNCV_3633031 [Trichonephila clavipes]
MSRSIGQSEARPPVFKSPSKLGSHRSTHYSRDERLSQPSRPGIEPDPVGHHGQRYTKQLIQVQTGTSEDVITPTGSRASSLSRFSLNEITIRIISTVKSYFRLYSPKKLGISDDVSTGYM